MTTLTPGARLGPYEVVGLLGSGGMGEVYRARDVRLGRDVAVKILPHALAANREALARFDHEARVLASLNHPNIAAIHGIEQWPPEGGPHVPDLVGAGFSRRVRALILELVAGETLAERLEKRRPLPIGETVAIARQVADALDAAHERGIVHRDLKPSNVMIAADGTVKVLDFGIAKTNWPSHTLASDDTMAAAPATLPATLPGIVVGTLAYMSPEQARGQAVDKRTDIWAFGCVIYQMATGEAPFARETSSDVLAAVLERDPDWTRLAAVAPPRLVALVRRCLTKDPKRRLRDIGDARLDLEDVDRGETATAPVTPPRDLRVPVIVALLTAAVGLVAGWAIATRSASTVPPRAARVSVDVRPADVLIGAHPLERSIYGRTRPSRTAMALSPDGATMAFTGERGGVEQLYIRALDKADAAPVAGTEGADGPFFSPDGRWVGFWSDGALRKISVDGGAVIKLCEATQPAGAFWASDDTIVFAQRGTIWRVPGAGGAASEITRRPADGTEARHLLPQMLPGGEWLLFTVLPTGNDWTTTHVVVQSVKTGERRLLVNGAADGRYVPTGHLIYMKLGTLMAVPFDVNRAAVTGGEFIVQRGVMQSVNSTYPNGLDTGAGELTFSSAGTLAYVSGDVHPDYEGRLEWRDRNGTVQEMPVQGPVRPYFEPRLSPDGTELIVATFGLRDQSLWRYDFAARTLARLTTEGRAEQPVFSPDGRRIAFSLSQNSYQRLFVMPADASAPPQRLAGGSEPVFPGAWTSDGRSVVLSTQADIKLLDVDTADRTRTLVASRFLERQPALSPDGRWLAYTSNETGQDEIYVQSFPALAGKRVISTDGGAEPAWSHGALSYISTRGGERRVMQLSVTTAGDQMVAGVPKALFAVDSMHYSDSAAGRNYDVSVDGSRFVFVRETHPPGTSSPRQIELVQNWFSELRQRAQGK